METMTKSRFEQMMEFLTKNPAISLRETNGNAPIDPDATHYIAVLVFGGMTYVMGDLFIRFDEEEDEEE